MKIKYLAILLLCPAFANAYTVTFGAVVTDVPAEVGTQTNGGWTSAATGNAFEVEADEQIYLRLAADDAQVYALASWDSNNASTFASYPFGFDLDTGGGGGDLSLQYNAEGWFTQGTLSLSAGATTLTPFHPVPEPATGLLWFLPAVLLSRRRLRVGSVQRPVRSR